MDETARATGLRVAAALVPLAVGAVLYRPVLFEGQAFFDRDILGLVYGSAEAFVSCFRAGSWPLWNPWVGFGQPLLADPSYQALYPVTWLNLLLPATTWFTVYVLLHAAWGALGMAAAARALGLSLPARAAAASLWLGAGPLLSMVDMWQHFAGAAWLPWSVLAAAAALRRPSRGRVVLWAIVLALQVLCGSVEMLLASGALTLVAASAALRDGVAIRRALPAALAAVLLAAGLTAVQWLPALGLLFSSERARLAEAARTTWSLHPAQLAQHLLPLRSSELSLSDAARRQLFGERQPMQESLYLGAASIPLLLAALQSTRRRLALLLAALAVAATLLAFGEHTPLLGWILRLLPPLRIFRFPAKLTVLAAFAWALLAALGADAWVRRASAGGRGWMLAVAAPSTALALLVGAAVFVMPPFGPGQARVELAAALVSAVAALAWLSAVPRWREPAGIAVVLLACADVALANREVSPTAPRALLERRPASTAFMPRQPLTRIHALETNALVALPWQGLTAPQAWAVAAQEAMAGTTPVRWGYSASFGTSFVVTPDPRYLRLTRALEAALGTPGYLRLLRQAGVSYVIAEEPVALPGLQPVATLAGPFVVPVRVLRVPDPLPRAYVAAETTIADDGAALRLLLDGTIAGAGRIVLPEGRPETSPSLHGEGRIVSHAPDRVELAARLDAPGHLVLLDAWDEGWRATVDGRPAAIERANVAFRAVSVPAGDHRVVMLYRPPSLLAGLALSAVAALALAGAALTSSTLRGERRTIDG